MSIVHVQPIALPPTPATLEFEDSPSRSSIRNWNGGVHRLRAFVIELYHNNLGLIFIATSQLFMTFMNIAVKILNGLDNPVPTLEVPDGSRIILPPIF